MIDFYGEKNHKYYDRFNNQVDQNVSQKLKDNKKP